MKITHPTGSSN